MKTTRTNFPISCLLIFALMISGASFFSYTNYLINNFDNTPVRPGQPEHQAELKAMTQECRRRRIWLDIIQKRSCGQDWLDETVKHPFLTFGQLTAVGRRGERRRDGWPLQVPPRREDGVLRHIISRSHPR